MRRPDESYGDYRAIHWHDYHGWCDHASSAAILLGTCSDPAELAGRDRSGGRGKKRNLVARVPSGGSLVWIKWFRPRGPLSWLRYLGRPTKAEKAWDIAFALLDAGVNTPRPLAGLQRTGALSRTFAVIVFEDFGNASHFAAALEAAGERRPELLAGAARFLARFHDAGFRHRDLQGANLLVRARDDGYAFSLIDVNRARAHARLRMPQRLRDLERLPLGEDDLDTFFDAYMRGDGARAAAHFRRRMRQRARLQRLPWPLNRLARRLWYYWRELTTYSPVRRLSRPSRRSP